MIRRVQLDLGPVTMQRLEALKARMEAASYAEVVRQALRVLEREAGDLGAPTRHIPVTTE